MQNRLIRTAAVCMVMLVASSLTSANAGNAETVRDDFEAPQLSALWNDKFAPSGRLSLRAGDAAEGRQFLVLSVRPGDHDANCECQRTEIRESDVVQPEFESDLWYRFSLKLDNISGGNATTRWMLGGWKQEADGSPFLAMRFEGGVFYITLESAQTRIMLGSTLVDARGFLQVVKEQGQKFGFITDSSLYLTDSGIRLKHGKVKYLPDPRSGWVDLMFRIKGSLDGQGIVELYANGNFVVRASGKIGVEAPAGSRQYLRLGHRRDRAGTGADLLIDDFRRGTSREAVSD